MKEWQREQHRQLSALLTTVTSGSNLFYQNKLQQSGITLPLEDPASFFQFPLTTKQELLADQEAFPPYGTNLSFPLNLYTRYHQTSGTSGTPLRWLDTPESWNWMVANWVKVFQAAGVAPGDRVMFAFSFGPFLGFWTAFEAAAKLGCLCLPGGGMSTAARLELMIANEARVLCCTPTYALRLGETAAAEGRSMETIRRILVAGEPGGGIPEVRSRLEQLFPSARVIDHHGMTEVGPVSYSHEEDPDHLCILEQSYLAEVLDPATGLQVEPGRQGELVLTTLGRLGSPLIRYRTGDLVQCSARVPVDLASYRLAGGILGRIDDMILVRGVNIYPSAVESVIRGFSEVSEFQVVIHQDREMSELELKIEVTPEAKNPEALLQQLGEALRKAFALRIPVQLVPENSLPRFEMKARRWVRS